MKDLIAHIIATIIIVLMIVVVIGIDFLIAAGIVKLVCWCFGLVFSWKVTLGIWVLLCVFSTFIRATRGSK